MLCKLVQLGILGIFRWKLSSFFPTFGGITGIACCWLVQTTSDFSCELHVVCCFLCTRPQLFLLHHPWSGWRQPLLWRMATSPSPSTLPLWVAVLIGSQVWRRWLQSLVMAETSLIDLFLCGFPFDIVLLKSVKFANIFFYDLWIFISGQKLSTHVEIAQNNQRPPKQCKQHYIHMFILNSICIIIR